eukprot:15464930-Alexandrium_andersonii.AAC.1
MRTTIRGMPQHWLLAHGRAPSGARSLSQRRFRTFGRPPHRWRAVIDSYPPGRCGPLLLCGSPVVHRMVPLGGRVGRSGGSRSGSVR